MADDTLLRSTSREPVLLRMSRDLVRTIKRGHPWVYAEGLRVAQLENARARACTRTMLYERRAAARDQDEGVARIRLVVEFRVRVKEHPLIGVGDDQAGIDPLLVAILVARVGIVVGQAIGTEPARGCLVERIVARLLRFVMLVVGTMDAVQRIGGVLVALAPRRPKVGNDAVLAIVADDLLDALGELVDLHLDGILEAVAGILPHSAGYGDEAAAQQSVGADLHLGLYRRVEPLERAGVELLELVLAQLPVVGLVVAVGGHAPMIRARAVPCV